MRRSRHLPPPRPPGARSFSQCEGVGRAHAARRAGCMVRPRRRRWLGYLRLSFRVDGLAPSIPRTRSSNHNLLDLGSLVHVPGPRSALGNQRCAPRCDPSPTCTIAVIGRERPVPGLPTPPAMIPPRRSPIPCSTCCTLQASEDAWTTVGPPTSSSTISSPAGRQSDGVGSCRWATAMTKSRGRLVQGQDAAGQTRQRQEVRRCTAKRGDAAGRKLPGFARPGGGTRSRACRWAPAVAGHRLNALDRFAWISAFSSGEVDFRFRVDLPGRRRQHQRAAPPALDQLWSR